MLTQRPLVALTFGDLDYVTALLPRLKAAINRTRRMDLALFQSAQSWYAFQRGDLATAQKHGQLSVDAVFEAGATTIKTYGLLGRTIQQLESGDWARAADAYRHGLEVDNLSEELSCRLMQCELKRNQAAAALEVYRRCRHMLSIVLGIKPSPATEAVHRKILGQD